MRSQVELYGTGYIRRALQQIPGVKECVQVMKLCQDRQVMFDVIYIKHERQCFITFPNTEKRVENMTCSRVFFTKFNVFGNVMKHF